jgi:hypothetical protein
MVDEFQSVEELMVEKARQRVFSVRTRNNFVLDTLMLISGLVSILSGIYFLFLPVGGYMGGRNPFYGIIIFFERHTWDDIHIWSSAAIMAFVLLHIPLHWDWIIKMTKTGFWSLVGKRNLNKKSLSNLFINVMIGASGLVCSLSGLYFLFLSQTPFLIFPALIWDMIHTWSGVVLTAVAILHFGIHWRWVVKVAKKYCQAFRKNTHVFGQDPRRQDTVQVPVERVS